VSCSLCGLRRAPALLLTLAPRVEAAGAGTPGWRIMYTCRWQQQQEGSNTKSRQSGWQDVLVAAQAAVALGPVDTPPLTLVTPKNAPPPVQQGCLICLRTTPDACMKPFGLVMPVQSSCCTHLQKVCAWQGAAHETATYLPAFPPAPPPPHRRTPHVTAVHPQPRTHPYPTQHAPLPHSHIAHPSPPTALTLSLLAKDCTLVSMGVNNPT
jgi:hypothetical protein